MSASDVAIVAALIFAWGTLSARLERFDVTAPITFVVVGVLLTHGPVAPLGFAPSHELVKALAETTLVLVLFSDASRVRLRDLQADMGLCLRLLGIGLPLTIGLGTLLALALFANMSIWLALLVGAALAPTDAALGAGMMVNAGGADPDPAADQRRERAQRRDRHAVRAGRDGGSRDRGACRQHRSRPGGRRTRAGRAHRRLSWAARAVSWCRRLAAAAGSTGTSRARRYWRWQCAPMPARWRCTAMASSPRSWAGSRSVPSGGRRGERLVPFVEETGALVSLLVWLAFGAVAVVPALESLTWQIVVYAVLSLTVIRMAPVAVALVGARLGRAAVAFIGWFGPRGLASVVFALLALEDLGEHAAGPGGRGHRRDRPAQRHSARSERRSAGPPLWAADRLGPGRR